MKKGKIGSCLMNNDLPEWKGLEWGMKRDWFCKILMSSEVIGNSFMLHSSFNRPLAEVGQGSSIEDPTKKK